jgi:hypothetical protein
MLLHRINNRLLPGELGAPTLQDDCRPLTGYQNTSRRRVSDDRSSHSALGLDVCSPLTKDEHPVRFPAGAPHPKVGLLMAGHHRCGSPTLRVRVAHQPGNRGDPETRRRMDIRDNQGSNSKASTCAGRTTVKWRRSSVASCVIPSRSPATTTDASTAPSGRSP